MRFAFHYLAWLNVADGILSFLGLQLQVINEGNWLMKTLYEHNPYLFLFCKLSFSIALYVLLLYRFTFRTKAIQVLTYSASILYTVVLIIHGIWISALL